MQKEQERQDVYASVYGDLTENIRASVHVWVNLDGTLTSTSYNLSDSTGDHDIKHPHKAGRPHIQQLREMGKQAYSKALGIIAYKAARRRDTEFSGLRFAFLVTEGRGGHTVYFSP